MTVRDQRVSGGRSSSQSHVPSTTTLFAGTAALCGRGRGVSRGIADAVAEEGVVPLERAAIAFA